MKILLTSSSRHGATDEVAGAIAERLRASGIDVDRARPEAETSVEGYDAVVIGTAIFSVGLSGLPKGRVADPRRIGPVLLSMDPKDHITFPGRFDPSELSWRERSIARMGGASEGDFIDLDAVRGWADAIATTLTSQA